MKKIKISPQVCFLLVVFIVLHMTYIQGVIPPQVGWWNYYAWRVNSGEILYKDIFCFLPPYYVYLMAFLYKIFGTFMMGYQIFGLFLRFVEVYVVYSIVNTFASKNISFLSTFAGLVLEVSYLMDMPFDYNQLIRFYIIMSAFFCMKALLQKKDHVANIYLAISGIWLGIGTFSKQTCIVIIGFEILGIIMFYLHNNSIWYAVKKAIVLIIGVVVAILPGILALIIQGSFDDFVYCIQASMSVKGDFGGFFGRIYQYQVHFLEIIIAILIFMLLCGQALYEKYMSKAFYNKTRVLIKEIYFLLLFLLITYRICQIIQTETGNVVSYATVIISAMIYIGMRIIIIWLQKVILKIKIATVIERLIPIILCIVLLMTIIITYALNYQWKSTIYYQAALFTIKRGLVNIIFWTMLLVLIRQIIQFIMKREIYGGFRCFVLNAFNLCLIGLSMISSVVEEYYIFPIAALFFGLLFNAAFNYAKSENKKGERNVPYKATVGLAIIGTILSVLFITIIQKQVVAYTWHRWDSVGLGRTNVSYVYSSIDGLEGYVLDVETEKAYKTIVNLIEEYTDKKEIVYEFPSIPLFNVLTERRQGTYSPVHYFDVCPDEIAIKDAEYLNNNPPKMVIWCEFGDSLWDFHESYFRDGNASGQRAIRDFYWNTVQQKYTKLYEYQSLSVWLKEY